MGGPELTWIHDTRRPEPLDAQTGMYNSIQVFATDNVFLTSEANYAHFDWSNSTYYGLGEEKKFILARNTRFGMERVFGEARYEAIPLPERLYAGGPESLRGIPDQFGGSARLADRLSHRRRGSFREPDGTAFAQSAACPTSATPWGSCFSTTWETSSITLLTSGRARSGSSSRTATRARRRRTSLLAQQEQVTRSSSTNPTGQCDFNDFSHTVGVGLRYHTPIGPIRFDIGYNLNPPVYPVLVTYGNSNATNSNNLTCYPEPERNPVLRTGGAL